MFGNLKQLPKPTGKYPVGITQMDFVDESRIDVFPFEKGAFREISATIFYPAENVDGMDTAAYIFPEILNGVLEWLPRLMLRNIPKVKSSCYQDADLASGEIKYPVIFYNHGYGFYSRQDTTLCSNLASNGYIVVSVDHPYESAGVKFLDGHIIYGHPDNLSSSAKPDPELLKFLKQLTKEQDEYFSDEKAMKAAEFVLKYDSGFSKKVKIWEEDTRYIADQLEKANRGEIESRFTNKLDISNGFGVTGHSLGGTTAAQICFNDKRFSCGINIDGGTYGEYFKKEFDSPFLVICAHLVKNIGRTTFLYNTKDSYLVTIDDTAHQGYSDMIFIARQMNLLNLLGKREKYEFKEIYSQYHLKFFDKYLKGMKDINLSDLKYNGVEYRENLKTG